MQLSTAECCRLAEALDRLAEGAWRDFEDRLWLGFGDDWTRVVALLKGHGYLRFSGRWKDEPVLTDEGETFLERLRARPETAAG